jgi:SPP1 gp7 family putative phage head morphogenesis protein
MARETRQILFEGVQQGKGIDDVVRDMRARIDVSKSRARVIARTETIQAYQRSGTNEAERASVELGEEVLMRWLTVRDIRVRHLHATWHGTLATPKENRARINVSPWNCRCAQAPVIPEANTEKKRKKFKKEREALLLIERR